MTKDGFARPFDKLREHLRQAQGAGLFGMTVFLQGDSFFHFIAKQYRATEGVFNSKARQALEGRAKHVA